MTTAARSVENRIRSGVTYLDPVVSAGSVVLLIPARSWFLQLQGQANQGPDQAYLLEMAVRHLRVQVPLCTFPGEPRDVSG